MKRPEKSRATAPKVNTSETTQPGITQNFHGPVEVVAGRDSKAGPVPRRGDDPLESARQAKFYRDTGIANCGPGKREALEFLGTKGLGMQALRAACSRELLRWSDTHQRLYVHIGWAPPAVFLALLVIYGVMVALMVQAFSTGMWGHGSATQVSILGGATVFIAVSGLVIKRLLWRPIATAMQVRRVLKAPAQALQAKRPQRKQATPEQSQVLALLRQVPDDSAVLDFMDREFGTRYVKDLTPPQCYRVRRYAEVVLSKVPAKQ